MAVQQAVRLPEAPDNQTDLNAEIPVPLFVLSAWYNTYVTADGTLINSDELLGPHNPIAFIDLSAETAPIAAFGAALIAGGWMAAS